MRIVFLCGSLEPGCDGVGDYTRRLSGELIGRGYKVGIIALRDKFTMEEFDGEQESDGIEIPVLRLPSEWLSIKRFKHAGIWVDDFNPEWLSLQFVPFAFHPQGLSFKINKALKRLGKGRRWHIMAHELWVGMDKEASLKFVFWGWLQRQLIKSLFTKLKPRIIHTQSNLYSKMLEKIGIDAKILPLFGNIPLTSNQHIKEDDIRKKISFVVFGGIHSGAPVKELVNELKLYSISNGIEIFMRIAGRNGREQLLWENQCKEVDLPLQISGQESPQSISYLLSNSSFGISTTPAFLIDKSGSVAAMREHSLKILCVSRDWNPRGIKGIKLPAGVMQYRPGELEQFIKWDYRSCNSFNISDVTNQFDTDLLEAI
ncbi:MAG: hypothetical protein ABIO81_12335 [Ginsengibacter sp.]